MSDKKFTARKEIQPKDDAGQPIGQPHVYTAEADTQVEADQLLLDKMADGIANGTKKIHQLTRETKLGVGDNKAPEGGIPEPEPLKPITKKSLSADEKFQIANELRDPSTVDKAFDRLFEARFGRNPDEAAKQQDTTSEDARIMRGRAEVEKFIDYHPEYMRCKENQDAMLAYLFKHRLALRLENLEIAFTELSPNGLLKLRSEEAPVIPVTAEEPEVRTEPEAQPTTKTTPTFPAAMRRGSTTGIAPVKQKGPSAADIAVMSAEQLKKIFPELAAAR